MQIRIYQIDAFTDKIFSGNPAAVCPLDTWLPDEVMQKIAMENNLAETAFYVKEATGLRIRWFTPAVEVDLCGHATLAAAFVLFHHENYNGDQVTFNSRSGPLLVTKKENTLVLNFPSDVLSEVALTEDLTSGFNIKPVKAIKGKTDYMLVYEREAQVKALTPDLRQLAKIKARGIIVTAKGDHVDFVSRFFGPQSGVDEDPVTGSAHTTLTPYWAKALGKSTLTAFQCSSRGGNLLCEFKGDRVEIGGQAKTFLVGNIFVDLI